MGPAKIKRISTDFIAFDDETVTSDLFSLCRIGHCRGGMGAWKRGSTGVRKLGSKEAGRMIIGDKEFLGMIYKSI